MKILLVDNHDLVLDGLSRMLNTNRIDNEILRAGSGEEAFYIAKTDNPDLIVSDYQMEKVNGYELLTKLRNSNNNTPLIFISMISEPAVIQNLLDAGALGFIHKESSTDEMIHGIQQALEGKNYVCRYTNSLLKNYTPHEQQAFLTKRELEILKHIVDEKKNQQIAEELHIQVSTVETHKKNLIKKLKVKSSLGLVKYALQHQLF